MTVEHLTKSEVKTLDSFLVSGQINQKMLLLEMSIGLDSMGPVRDPMTDRFFPGMTETLGKFSEALERYKLMFMVATNGPDIEGVDILNSLKGPVAAAAVTQGGGKLISRYPETGELKYTTLAQKEELARLKDLEQEATERPLMRALLGDRMSTNGKPPIRTPYDTNIVMTLPANFEVLNARLSAAGVDLQKELPGVEPTNYVKQVLDYAHNQYIEAIQRLGMEAGTTVLTKLQNRRNYVMPRHNILGEVLSKYSGAVIGSKCMSFAPGYHLLTYELENSLYVADKAVDITGEGQQIIGVSEKNMIIGPVTYFGENSPNHRDINVTNKRLIPTDLGTLYLADVTCRLAVNITMDGSPPRMDRVEDVPVLHIGSGLKALEAITYLYQQLYG